MPTYEYTCRNCGHTFDIVQAMSDESMTICPECGGELRKVFAPPSIAFKGSGFYATDHGKKSKKADEQPADATAAKSDAKSDAKSEKTAETAGPKDSPKPSSDKKPAKSSETKS
jgi:putative FmdB family regulatory protein